MEQIRILNITGDIDVNEFKLKGKGITSNNIRCSWIITIKKLNITTIPTTEQTSNNYNIIHNQRIYNIKKQILLNTYDFENEGIGLKEFNYLENNISPVLMINIWGILVADL